MLTDKLLTVGMPVALSTASPATSKLGDAIDLAVADLDQGEGWPFYFYASVAVAATSGGAATLALQVVTADNEALTTNPTVLLTTPTYALAAVGPAGARLAMISIPKGLLYQRWLGVRQVVGGAAFTAGSVNAFFTLDPDNWRAYPEGMN